MINPNTNTSNPAKKHHYLRTPLAALFGFIAVIFILNGVVSVWLNKTLTDTPTFTDTVAPLIETPEIQEFIATKAAFSVVNSVPLEELSSGLLPANKTAGKSSEQVRILAEEEVKKRVLTAVSDPALAQTWRKSTEQNHEYLISQLKSNSETITLDFTSVAEHAIAQLKRSDIGIAADELKLENNAAKLKIQRSELGPMANLFETLQTNMIISLVGAAVAVAASVYLSVHHMKTLRRVLMLSGIFSLIIFFVLHAPHLIPATGPNAADQKAFVAITDAIFADLKTAFLIVGIVSIVAAVATKLVNVFRLKKNA